MGLAALWAAEAASLRLPFEAAEADHAEVVAAWQQVGVNVQVQAHRTCELLLQDTRQLRLGRCHFGIWAEER